MAEGGGLLNRCRVKSSTGGSNPPLSATTPSEDFRYNPRSEDKPQKIWGLRFLVSRAVQLKPEILGYTFGYMKSQKGYILPSRGEHAAFRYRNQEVSTGR